MLRLLDFELRVGDGEAVWVDSGDQWASLVPSDIGVSATEEYELTVSVELVDGRLASALVEGLMFAAPPTLHGVEAGLLNGSAALNWFNVAVNATGVTELVYDYWPVGVKDSWKYLVQWNASAEVVMGVPSTRGFVLEVTVTNVYESSTTCADCPLLEAGWMGSAVVEEVVQNVVELVDDVGSSVILAGIDVVDSDSQDVMEFFDLFLNFLIGGNATVISQDVVVLSEFVENGIVDGVLEAFELLDGRLDGVADSTLELYIGHRRRARGDCEGATRPVGRRGIAR